MAGAETEGAGGGGPVLCQPTPGSSTDGNREGRCSQPGGAGRQPNCLGAHLLPGVLLSPGSRTWSPYSLECEYASLTSALTLWSRPRDGVSPARPGPVCGLRQQDGHTGDRPVRWGRCPCRSPDGRGHDRVLGHMAPLWRLRGPERFGMHKSTIWRKVARFRQIPASTPTSSRCPGSRLTRPSTGPPRGPRWKTTALVDLRVTPM